MSPAQNSRVNTGTKPKTSRSNNRTDINQEEDILNRSGTSRENSATSGDGELESYTHQNQLLSRLRDQQEKLRSLQQQQVVLLQLQDDAHRQLRECQKDPKEEQVIMKFPDPRELQNNLSALADKISHVKRLQPQPPPPQQRQPEYEESDNFTQSAGFSALMSEKAELLGKLKMLEERKRQMDFMLHQFDGTKDGPPIDPRSLKHRMSELHSLVSALEQQRPSEDAAANMPVVKREAFEEERVEFPSMQAEEVLAEMQEQLRLQQQLQQKRRELESIMRKDYLQESSKNEDHPTSESSPISPYQDEPGPPANHSIGSRENRLIHSLQMQVQVLHQQMAKLQSSSQHEDDPNSAALTMLVQQQGQQLQHLTQTVAQCFQSLLGMQREISSLHQTVDKLTMRSGSSSRDDHHPSWNPIPDYVFEPIASRSLLEHHHHHHANGGSVMSNSSHQSPMNSDVWGYQSPSTYGGMPGSLNHFCDTEVNNARSAAGALNNQIAPGMRANNYWDNFRSFSRQNRLQSTTTVAPSLPTTVVAPNVAQVTPRQIPSAANLRNSSAVSDRGSVGAPSSDQGFSPSRPRRKQKINREQNDARRNGAAAAATVFPVQHYEERNLNRESASSDQSVRSLTRSIYWQVSNLVNQSDEEPEELARLLRDLLRLQPTENDLGGSTVGASEPLLPNNYMPPSPPPPWRALGESLNPAGSDDDNDSFEVRQAEGRPPSNTRRHSPKLTVDKKFPVLNGRNRLYHMGGGASPTLDDEIGPQPIGSTNNSSASVLFPICNPLGFCPPAASSAANNPIALSEGAAQQQPAATANIDADKKTNVAVPKNIQRNIISRVRDTRKRSKKEDDEMFINIDINFNDGASAAPASIDTTGTSSGEFNTAAEQSEMAEADQAHSPDGGGAVGGAVGGEESPHFNQQGLDRVPTRLSSNELELRRQEEEESLQNLVDEVLNSSSDTDVLGTDNVQPPL